eukprot:11811117-Karenia_brevis.AAC.1
MRRCPASLKSQSTWARHFTALAGSMTQGPPTNCMATLARNACTAPPCSNHRHITAHRQGLA